jgi:hypothetical protein
MDSGGALETDESYSRRRFLSYLAASPVFLLRRHPERSEGSAVGFDAFTRLLEQEPALIPTPRHALNVFDFEPVAKKKLPPAHWAYLATGSDDDGTIRANREGFNRYELRVRRLVDVSRIDTSVGMFGVKWPTPIVINPIGSQKAFHPEGEIAVARAREGVEPPASALDSRDHVVRGLERRAGPTRVVPAV